MLATIMLVFKYLQLGYNYMYYKVYNNVKNDTDYKIKYGFIIWLIAIRILVLLSLK